MKDRSFHMLCFRGIQLSQDSSSSCLKLCGVTMVRSSYLKLGTKTSTGNTYRLHTLQPQNFACVNMAVDSSLNGKVLM